jgi:hypothetical protein
VTNSTAVRFDANMMARYGLSGPRYTSYPTALQFNRQIDAGTSGRASPDCDNPRERRYKPGFESQRDAIIVDPTDDEAIASRDTKQGKSIWAHDTWDLTDGSCPTSQ